MSRSKTKLCSRLTHKHESYPEVGCHSGCDAWYWCTDESSTFVYCKNGVAINNAIPLKCCTRHSGSVICDTPLWITEVNNLKLLFLSSTWKSLGKRFSSVWPRAKISLTPLHECVDAPSRCTSVDVQDIVMKWGLRYRSELCKFHIAFYIFRFMMRVIECVHVITLLIHINTLKDFNFSSWCCDICFQLQLLHFCFFFLQL